jgi:glycosyltransferase involved in cell wall biosynthesis
MVKVGILETQAHEQVVYYLSEILTSGDHTVTLYTNNKIREEMEELQGGAGNINLVVKKEEQTIWSFLSEVEKDVEKKDVLIIQPLYGGIRELLPFARFNPKCKIMLIVFNINTWLFDISSLRKNLKRIGQKFVRRQIVNNADGYLVEYPVLEDYIRENSSTNKNLHYFVPTIYEESNIKKSTEEITIVVPGNISPSRRNYNLILELFKKVSEPNGLLHLNLLGKPENSRGERIIDRCKELSEEGYNVSWAREWIPFEQFHKEIQQSDIILAPLMNKFDRFGVTEYYGKSKGSGCISDALRNGKPIVLPSHFQAEKVMGEGAVYYQNKPDLESIMREIKNNSYFLRNLKTEAIKASERHRISCQLNRFEEIISDYLS